MEQEEEEDDQYALERIFHRDVYKEENKTFDNVGSERALTSGDEAWVVPLLVVSGVSLTVVLVYQVVVVLRASRTSPSRRHLFLSQALLPTPWRRRRGRRRRTGRRPSGTARRRRESRTPWKRSSNFSLPGTRSSGQS